MRGLLRARRRERANKNRNRPWPATGLPRRLRTHGLNHRLIVRTRASTRLHHCNWPAKSLSFATTATALRSRHVLLICSVFV